MRTLIVGLLLLPTFVLAAAPPMPTDAELKTLTRDSLLNFNQMLQTKDSTAFHKYISKLWQDQITPKQLQEVFQSFIDQKIDLAGVAKAEPIFQEPPAINSDGLLVVEGSYANAPGRIDFRLKYVYAKPAWKLFGIKVNVSPTGSVPDKAPSETEAVNLVRTSLLEFNQAVQEKDFTNFHQKIATVWQAQTSPEKLEAIFQSFIEQEIDLTLIENMTPKFEQPPALNDDGVLVMQGSYSTRPSGLRFQLGYLFENSEWKLIKIKVDIDPLPQEEESDTKSKDE